MQIVREADRYTDKKYKGIEKRRQWKKRQNGSRKAPKKRQTVSRKKK